MGIVTPYRIDGVLGGFPLISHPLLIPTRYLSPTVTPTLGESRLRFREGRSKVRAGEWRGLCAARRAHSGHQGPPATPDGSSLSLRGRPLPSDVLTPKRRWEESCHGCSPEPQASHRISNEMVVCPVDGLGFKSQLCHWAVMRDELRPSCPRGWSVFPTPSMLPTALALANGVE